MNNLRRVVLVVGLWLPLLILASPVAISSSPRGCGIFCRLVLPAAAPPAGLEKRSSSSVVVSPSPRGCGIFCRLVLPAAAPPAGLEKRSSSSVAVSPSPRGCGIFCRLVLPAAAPPAELENRNSSPVAVLPSPRGCGIFCRRLVLPVVALHARLEKRNCGSTWTRTLSCRGKPKNSKTPTKSKHVGISKDLLAKFKLYSEYAAAAYCIGNNNSPETPVTCPCNNCELVEEANATTISEFENTIKTDDTGFIAIDKFHKVIVLAFRGSRSKKNWFADLDITRRNTDLCHGCRVHQGFWKSWTEAAPVVIPKIEDAAKKHPEYDVVVTGHSLGAAVATLAAAKIRKLGPHFADKTELYTFGSPRVGDETTAEFLTRQSNKSYRVTAVNDFVPRLPGNILHYKHMSPEYWIDKNPDNPSTDDIVVLTGTYNTDGNSGRHGFSDKAHGHYLGPIVKCDSSTKAKSSSKAGHKRDVSGGLDRVGGVALDLLAPYINASMLTVRDSELGRSITFPPGSVADVALEAVHGPDADRDTSTTVCFGADD